MLVLINSFRSFSRSILTQADHGLIMQKRKDLPFDIEVFPYINHFIRIPAVTPGCLLCAVRLCGLLRVRINVTVIVCLCQLTGAHRAVLHRVNSLAWDVYKRQVSGGKESGRQLWERRRNDGQSGSDFYGKAAEKGISVKMCIRDRYWGTWQCFSAESDYCNCRWGK